jgi:hypothetical protein
MLDFFDNIYIINLPHRTDRKKEIEEQFSNIGLSIDGDRIRFFSAIRPDTPGGFTTVGARGCFMSHLGILTEARDRGSKNILILEDDCNFVSNFSEKLQVIQTAMAQRTWSFFYGGALNVIEPEKLHNGWLSPAQGVMGAHFFAASGSVLPELVQYLELMLTRPPGDAMGGPMHVDGAYSWFRAAHPGYSSFLAVPELAYQRSSATDIHIRKWYEKPLLNQWILGYLRKLKNAIRNTKR